MTKRRDKVNTALLVLTLALVLVGIASAIPDPNASLRALGLIGVFLLSIVFRTGLLDILRL